MKLHNLQPAKGGQVKEKKRVGRGYGSKWGGTSGRGHDGQNSRSGGGVRPGFEGGQLPLFRRVPKRGFNNKDFAKQIETVNLQDLNIFEDGQEVTVEDLINRGLVNKSKMKDGVKILAKGDLNVKLTVKANAFSKAAEEKINEAGGKAEVI